MPAQLFFPHSGLSQRIISLAKTLDMQRQLFTRRWYDTNFFDDGYHFRSVSRITGKIVDPSDVSSGVAPQRAYPKASRQARGVANLLSQLEPHPSIYPEYTDPSQFPISQDPITGQPVRLGLREASDKAAEQAKREGHWVEEEWRNQYLQAKIAEMVLLTAKHGISYMEIWPDSLKKQLCTEVFDAFDILLAGNMTNLYDQPAIIKATPWMVNQIQANDYFDEVTRMTVIPDNKLAASDVKRAYLQARFGNMLSTDKEGSAIVYEAFMKEYLSESNWDQALALGQEKGALEGKSMGDMVMRHSFTTSAGTLLDEYLPLDEYPFAEYRMEPGLLYQTSMMERNIPANKSYDIIMSRIEGYSNTMTTGIYQKRMDENFKIANIPGGQVIEYKNTPLLQQQLAPIPAHVFNFIEILDSIIAEGGASTSALNQIPDGVRSGKAIESVKATEYANLKIATDRLKETVTHITERLIEAGSRFYFDPHQVDRMDGEKADYFKVIGEQGAVAREQAGLEIPEGTVVIKKNHKVRIDIESGLGYTIEGKKDTMGQIINYMTSLVQQGLVSPEALKIIVKKFLDIYQFGSTQEFMEALDMGAVTQAMGQDQLDQIKLAVAEVIKDLGLAGADKDEADIMKTKVAVLEAQKDSALPQGISDLPAEGMS